MKRISRSSPVLPSDRLVRRLHWLADGSEAAAEAVLAATAEEIRERAQATLRRAPGGLPALAQSVTVTEEAGGRSVSVRHEAAHFVEFGTRHLPPRPFLQPAADAERPAFRRRLIARMRRLQRERT